MTTQVINGTQYREHPSGNNGCAGCCLFNERVAATGKFFGAFHRDCDNAACTPRQRPDGRHVIFVQYKTQH